MLHSCRVLRLESCRRKETGYRSESVILPCIVGSPILVWKLAYFHTSVLPGQYKYQPYLKPWWNTAYSEMSVKNQIKQAPDKNLPFLHIFQNSRSKQKLFGFLDFWIFHNLLEILKGSVLCHKK